MCRGGVRLRLADQSRVYCLGQGEVTSVKFIVWFVSVVYPIPGTPWLGPRYEVFSFQYLVSPRL